MIDIAIAACKVSGSILREHLYRDLRVADWERHDVKLEVDKLCEEQIKQIILRRYPDHNILAEETGHTDRRSDYTWIIDPLDGTANYYRGLPHFSVSVALQKKDEIILGVVYDPYKDDLFVAQKGQGATLNGRAALVSKVERAEESYITIGFMKTDGSIRRGLSALEELAGSVSKIRMTGSAALDLCYVACGRFDAHVEYEVNMWDIAAGLLMVKEAGGEADFKPSPESGYDVLATNGRLHRELGDIIRL
jgi:myo-inositol-1(or 4)-monophosphatase